MGRKKRKLVSTLTPTEWKAVFATCDKRAPTGRRDLALYLMMYRTGMRLGEIQHLRLRDVDLDSGEIRTPEEGKSGQRIVYLPLYSPCIRDAMDAWLDVRNNGWAVDSPYFFTSRTGQMLDGGGVRTTLAHRAIKAGITHARVSPHMLRHTFATEMLAEGVDLQALADMLGHASVETTRVYVHSVRGRAQTLMRNRKLDD